MMNVRGKILRFRLLLLTLVIFPAVASTQTSKEVKEMFSQAEAYYLYGEYDLANTLYLTIAAYVPDNYNVVYKIGDCYLNIPDEKSKAIEFLEKAVKNSSYDANPDQLKEKRAPLDAYFSLAKAYMINNELEKALATLQSFEKLVGETKQKGGMRNAEYIKQQMLACNNAIALTATPIQLSKTKMPADFGLGSINDNPAVSFDGNTMVYTERRGVSNAILFSIKERGKWQSPIEITSQLNAGEDCSTSSLNKDGTEMFLYKNDGFDGNIYSSSYTNGAWSPIKKLNKNINTKFYESHASISYDGKKLYFSSNRDGGQGQLDIYVSEKDGTGDWGVAVNLGASINTPYNEDNPFITKNDSVLYFSSEGHYSMGGFDIFKSMNQGNAWKTPQNIGYPINTIQCQLIIKRKRFSTLALVLLPLHRNLKSRELSA
jgi:tetratricopeptide (TPR) repeat protein